MGGEGGGLIGRQVFVSANIGLGRDYAGIHWRSDTNESLKLGEAEDAVYLVGAEKIATFPQITTIMEPTTGFEPVTYGLRNRCSTS